MPEGRAGGGLEETVREIDEKPRMGRQACEGSQPRPGKSRLMALRHHDVGGPLVQGGNDGDGPALGPTLLRPSCLLALATACICCLHARVWRWPKIPGRPYPHSVGKTQLLCFP